MRSADPPVDGLTAATRLSQVRASLQGAAADRRGHFVHWGCSYDGVEAARLNGYSTCQPVTRQRCLRVLGANPDAVNGPNAGMADGGIAKKLPQMSTFGQKLGGPKRASGPFASHSVHASGAVQELQVRSAQEMTSRT
jgi:hypothetical protein